MDKDLNKKYSSVGSVKERTPHINSCPVKRYRYLMMTQMQIYRKYIKHQLTLNSKTEYVKDQITHFFNKFGKYFRMIFCGFACEERASCAVRTQPSFNIKEVYTFEDLRYFPVDFSMGVIINDCPYSRELNAIQLFIANNLKSLKENGIEAKKTKREFLLQYGPLLQEMFCSTVCPSRVTCKKDNRFIPQHYA